MIFVIRPSLDPGHVLFWYWSWLWRWLRSCSWRGCMAMTITVLMLMLLMMLRWCCGRCPGLNILRGFTESCHEQTRKLSSFPGEYPTIKACHPKALSCNIYSTYFLQSYCPPKVRFCGLPWANVKRLPFSLMPTHRRENRCLPMWARKNALRHRS